MKKVSFVCTTYRRFYCVRRILAQYAAQTYKNKELIIFNTDTENPIELGGLGIWDDVRIINNSIDYITKQPYTNRGDICRDAVTYCSGEYFMLADDDDIYLPYHIQQAVEGIEEIGKDAWKPQRSLFASGNGIEFAQNTMEASIIVKMDRIKEIGFRSDKTGYEGLSWYTVLRDKGELDEWNQNYIPSYCFNWSDPSHISGHKQSGDIDNPNNFENHKEGSKNRANEPLAPISDEELGKVYKPYYEFLKSKQNEIKEEYYFKYLTPLLIQKTAKKSVLIQYNM
jgi:hypothetical protein